MTPPEGPAAAVPSAPPPRSDHDGPAAFAGPAAGVPCPQPRAAPVTGAAARDDGDPAEARRLALRLGLLFALAGMGSSATAVVLPQVDASLGLAPGEVAWALSAYVLALAVATAVYGRLADVHGIRRPLIAGITLMLVGSAVSAAAPGLAVLLVGRVLQGSGAGAVPVLATTLLSARYGGAVRASALARTAGLAAAGGALGPLVGGTVEALVGWRAVVAVPAAAALLLPAVLKAASTRGTGGSLDARGAALVTAAAAGLVLLVQSVAAGPVAAGVGVALLLAATPLLVRHVRHRPDGFLPLAVVTSRVATGTALAAAAVPAAWFGLLLAVPTELAERGWTPLQTGLVLIPAAVTGLLAPRVSGPVLARLGGLRTLALAAAGAGAAVLLAALGAAVGSPTAMAAGVAGVTIAFGLGQPALIAAVGGAVPPQVRGIALGTATLVFLVGGGVGSAVVGGLTAVTSTAAALLVIAALAGTAALGAGYLARTAP